MGLYLGMFAVEERSRETRKSRAEHRVCHQTPSVGLARRPFAFSPRASEVVHQAPYLAGASHADTVARSPSAAPMTRSRRGGRDIQISTNHAPGEWSQIHLDRCCRPRGGGGFQSRCHRLWQGRCARFVLALFGQVWREQKKKNSKTMAR